MPRYIVYAPTLTQRNLGTVLTPGLTRTAASWSSRGPIFGQPGTMAVPAPRPATIRNEVTARASGGLFYSTDAPEVFYPSIYVLRGEQERAPVARVSDNQMPVPAVRPGAVIPASPLKTRKGGSRQIYQPQVVPAWPPLRRSPYA